VKVVKMLRRKEAGISDVVKGVSNLGNLSDGAKLEDLQAKLKSEKPLSSEELKAFAESLDGLKRTSYSGGSMYGAEVVSGEVRILSITRRKLKSISLMARARQLQQSWVWRKWASW
jgi:hypothetical protein